MQKPQLKLREIIWEITGRCENKCSYCGSKEVWNEEIDEKKIVKIAEEIAKYPPEEIDISGGDPLLVSYETHKKVVKILKDAGVKVKILINPKSYIPSAHDKIILLYDWMGVSVNTEEELEIIEDKTSKDLGVFSKMTIISNFNTSNLYFYEDIENFVKDRGLIWQIQFTMTKDKGLAIYENKKAMDKLATKITSSISDKVGVVPADNMNSGPCGAGTSSIGILNNGDIVPCLSMRSWCKIDDVKIANILDPEDTSKSKLEEIWKLGFGNYRYSEFKCCKDECNNIVFDLTSESKESFEDFLKGKRDEPIVQLYAVTLPPDDGFTGTPVYGTMMYGVRPNVTLVYGVQDYNVIAYAVFSGESSSGTYVYSSEEYCQCDNPEYDEGNNICKKCNKKIKRV